MDRETGEVEEANDWSESRELRERRKADRIYVAMGPIVGAVLVANLITALVVVVFFALLGRL